MAADNELTRDYKEIKKMLRAKHITLLGKDMFDLYRQLDIKKMKIISTLFIFFFSISCSLSDGKDYSYQDTMNVIYEYNKKISKEHSIELIAYGLHYAGTNKVYDGKIHIIDLGYSVDKHIKYEEARLLFYKLIDGLLQKINSTEYLGKYFFNNPVTYEDLFVTLSFDCYGKGFLKKGDVSRIYIYLNKVGCHIVEVEGAEEIKKKEVIPGVFVLEEWILKESLIEENPYTKEITYRRPCPTPLKPMEDIQSE